jgi:hydroxypyruvate isomerase
MSRCAVNLSFPYPELPLIDRFEAAVRDGFTAGGSSNGLAWRAKVL